MLSDAQWGELKPLIEACRPRAKTPPKELRCTISAILWQHQNGAKWRAIPEKLRPWWEVAQIFIRWARAGVWKRLLARVQERGVALGMAFLDGSNMRPHQKAAGAAKRGDLRPSEMIVKHLAALARLWHQGPRDRRRTRARHRLPHRAWAGTRTPSRHSAPRPVARRA